MDTPRLTPPIPLELDHLRHLRLDARGIFQAEREMCKLWGRQMNIVTVIGAGNLTLNDLSILLWQALLDDDPSLTLAETQELMAFDKLPGILTAVFDEWVAHDVGKVFIQLFESALASWLGLPASLCIFAETCGNAVALEHNGDVYSCDHYVSALLVMYNDAETTGYYDVQRIGGFILAKENLPTLNEHPLQVSLKR